MKGVLGVGGGGGVNGLNPRCQCFTFLFTLLLTGTILNSATHIHALSQKMQERQRTHHPLHTPLTKQANQTPIHTLVVFAIHSASGKKGPELNENNTRREKEREGERKKEGGKSANA